MTDLPVIKEPTNGIPKGRVRTVERVDTPIDRSEVRRYLGYPSRAAPKRNIEDTLDHWIVEGAKHALPRATYGIFAVVETAKRWIRIETSEGVVEFAGAIGEFIGPVDLLAVFIATAGPAVEKVASDLLKKGDYLGGMIVNAVGSERAEAAEAAVIDELRALAAATNRAMTLPYSPGYCGMAITEQRKLFTALNGAQVGVSLTPDCLMKPIKSVSGLIGLGEAAITREGSPCDHCTVHNCNMRR